MLRLFAFATLLALCIGARANTCAPLQAGATDQTVYVEFIDATTGVPNAGLAFNSSGIDLEYVRTGAAATDITEATQTAGGAHSDGGFVSVGHGRYRLDLPDAAVATGVPQVVIQGTITGYIMLPCVVALSPPVNVVRFGGTDGTFSGGRAEVNTSHWGGTAVASAVVPANMIQVSGDSGAADNLETAFDDTAGAVSWQGIIDQGTAQAATGTTLRLRSAAAFADDEIIGATCVITGGSAGVGQARTVTDYVSSTDTATVATWTTTPSGTITYKCYGTAAASGGGGDATAANQATIIAYVDDLETRLGTPSNLGGGATVSANLSDIEGQTDDIGAAGAGLTAADDAVMTRLGAPAGASIAADIASVKTDTGTTIPAAVAVIDGIVDQLLIGVNVSKINTVTITGNGSGTPFGVP